MKKTTLIWLALSISYYAFGQKNPTNPNIDHYIKKEMQELGIPGLAVAVIEEGKIMHCGTYGISNIEYHLPVTPNTTFQIASVSKLFTSTLVMKWIQEHKLSLDDYLNKYIDDVPLSWKDIQIRHLLAHEGGMPWPATLGGYIGTRPSANFKVEPIATIVKNLKDSVLRFSPGTKQAYQNGDYFVLQYILEKIGGKPIQEIFKQEIFAPLGMDNSGYDVEIRGFPFQTMLPVNNKSQNFSKGKNGPLIFKGFYSPASYCAGGMFLSIADGIKWAIALDKNSFISNAMQQQMATKTATNGGFTQLGWTTQTNNGHLMIGHSGGPGLGDIIRFPKEKLTIIVLSNYVDMNPYMAQAIAQFYVTDIKPSNLPKTFIRNLGN
ncbi:serine hydrolase [Pedobacter sp. UBA4863]|uniref:serine hydrolase domain-containing protein n=1 Tax=Pedobacter sp. UBA4863 TaxID=1947060 RepID=UPI0025F1435B|nr:serine hydrolase domain-containing protein [Pedobacter sp. UBA4863]